MRVPITWLKEYIDIKDSAEKIAEKLVMSGTEAELIKNNIDIDENIVVGEVLEVSKHPNADRLNVAQVAIGKKTFQIVCGGTNLAEWQKVPLALIGAKIGDFEIKETEIRGVKSSGMICSESELGLSDESNGEIMILDASLKNGTKLKDVLGQGEEILEAEITPNRGDCLSMIGIARELAAVTGKNIKEKKNKLTESPKKASGLLSVEIEEKDSCSRYVARVLRIDNNDEAPKWMRERLEQSGLRSISAVVDITNYVMLEMGQPLHAFDFDKISNKNNKKITIRKAKDGEGIETLDGVKRKLTSKDIIIADGKKPIAIAGVMGGKDTEVDEDTKVIILESATFDKTSVRKTAQRLALRSESSNRFEKGIPMNLNPLAVDRAAELINEICGGEIYEDRIDEVNKWIWIQHLGLDVRKLNNFMGQGIEEKEIIKILNSLGFEAEKFDIVKEAKKHLDKPYKWGASFKTDGVEAFDCGYLIDYIYSLIGQMVGHSAPQIMDSGKKVELSDLKPGDVLFRDGIWKKVKSKDRKGVSHVAMYIGDNKIIHAEDHYRKNKEWTELPKDEQKVRIDPLDIMTRDPQFLGARRLVENLDGLIAVTVPWWRLDVTIKEDIYEEIARIFGYNNIKSTIPTGEVPLNSDEKESNFIKRLKTSSIAYGFTEVLNYSFMDEKSLNKIGEDIKKAVRVNNPLSSDLEYMRTSLAPSMLKNIALNQNNFPEIKIFEIAHTYLKTKQELPLENYHFSGAVLGGESQGIRYKEGKEFYILKGALENIFDQFKLEFKKKNVSFLDKTKSAEVLISGKIVGYIGEVNKETQAFFDIKKKTAVFEIDLSEVAKVPQKEMAYKPFIRLPSVKRDLAFVFPQNVETESILRLIEGFEVDIIRNFEIIDIYVGKELYGKKSIAVRIEYQHEKRTLRDREVTELESKIVNVISKRLGGKLRDVKEG